MFTSLTNGAQFVVENSTVFVEGNFTQTSSGSLVFVISSEKANKLNVSGCVVIDGKIELDLKERPTQNVETYEIISYSCDKAADVSNDQIVVVPEYKQSECDEIKAQTSSTANSISVSLSSTFNKNCSKRKGLSTGALVGIIVGATFGALLIGALIWLVIWKETKRF